MFPFNCLLSQTKTRSGRTYFSKRGNWKSFFPSFLLGPEFRVLFFLYQLKTLQTQPLKQCRELNSLQYSKSWEHHNDLQEKTGPPEVGGGAGKREIESEEAPLNNQQLEYQKITDCNNSNLALIKKKKKTKIKKPASLLQSLLSGWREVCATA